MPNNTVKVTEWGNKHPLFERFPLAIRIGSTKEKLSFVTIVSSGEHTRCPIISSSPSQLDRLQISSQINRSCLHRKIGGGDLSLGSKLVEQIG